MSRVKYTEKILQEAVANSTSILGVISYLGLKHGGGTHKLISNKIFHYGIDISHFTGKAWRVGKGNTQIKRTPGNILVLLPEGSQREKTKLLRRAMIEVGINHSCVKCSNNGIWFDEFLLLEIDHIDGNPLNNRKENLRFLCPNCHSQTETHSRISRPPKVYYCLCGNIKTLRSKKCAECVKKENYKL